MMFTVLLLLVHSLWAARAPEPTPPPATQRVLVLHSYHIGYQWTDEITRGIRAALGSDPEIYLIYEYMDTKRYPSQAYWEQLARLYRNKYQGRRIDVIIACDNNAFEFMKAYGDEIFGPTPVVFCGVNYFQPEEIAGYPRFTGVNEAVDMEVTLRLMLDLHPETRRVVAVTDTTVTGRRIRRQLERLAAEYQNRIDLTILDDLSMPELKRRLQRLSVGTLVLYTFFFRDGEGRFFEYDEAMENIYLNTAVPIYGLWDFALGNGIVGGYLISGYTQGFEAGRLALRILDGDSPEDIPVVMESPNRFMFDYLQLERHRIAPDQLPPGSLIINEPFSFFERYRYWIIGTSSALAVLLLIIAGLSYLYVSRRAVQQRLLAANRDLVSEIGERQKAQEDREELVRVLTANNRELESIISISSHDLRSPLVNIQGFSGELGALHRSLSDLIRRGRFDEQTEREIRLLEEKEIPACLHFIRTNGLRINQLQEGLRKMFQRIREPIRIERLEINQLIGEVLEYLAPRLEEAGAQVNLEPLPDCYGDRQAVAQVFTSLLENSIKFRRPDRPLHIGIRGERRNQMADYIVSDNGIGIKPEHRKHIFEAFHKLDPAAEGEGLGLTIAQWIVHRLHGAIRVDSDPRRGTAVTVSLPTRKLKSPEELLT